MKWSSFKVTLVWYLLPDPAELQPKTCCVAWLNLPAGHQVAMAHTRLRALCVSSWKFSVLAGYQDVCSIQKRFSYLQRIIVYSTWKILFSMKAVFNKAKHGLGCWFPENSEYKKICTSEKKTTIVPLNFKNLLDIKYINQAEIWTGFSSCLGKHFLVGTLKHAILPT